MVIREGTAWGLMIISGEMPSQVKGMSSWRYWIPQVPFWPCREANLSPIWGMRTERTYAFWWYNRVNLKKSLEGEGDKIRFYTTWPLTLSEYEINKITEPLRKKETNNNNNNFDRRVLRLQIKHIKLFFNSLVRSLLGSKYFCRVQNRRESEIEKEILRKRKKK